MTDQTKSDVIARVRKILARTEENGCTEAEAAAALGLASRLMAEHALSMEVIEQAGGEAEGFTEEGIISTPTRQREHLLAACICRDHFHVDLLYTAQWQDHRRLRKLVFFGKPSQIEGARWVFHALTTAFENLWIAYKVTHNAGRADRITFITGVYHGFHRKLRDEAVADEAFRKAMARSGQGGGGTTLALVDGKRTTAFAAKHNDLKKGRRLDAGRGTVSAFDAGVEAGRSLNLNRAVGGTTRKALPKT